MVNVPTYIFRYFLKKSKQFFQYLDRLGLVNDKCIVLPCFQVPASLICWNPDLQTYITPVFQNGVGRERYIEKNIAISVSQGLLANF